MNGNGSRRVCTCAQKFSIFITLTYSIRRRHKPNKQEKKHISSFDNKCNFELEFDLPVLEVLLNTQNDRKNERERERAKERIEK